MFKIKLDGGRTMEVPKRTYWHTTSHILAQAVKRLYPEIKLAIGPSIDNGFYYDFDSEKPFTPEMLENIEQEMKKFRVRKICLATRRSFRVNERWTI